MEGGLSSLLRVHIDFDSSHMFFPTLMLYFLLFLLVVLGVTRGIPMIKAMSNGSRKLQFFIDNYDKVRLYGTIALTAMYYYLMDVVGLMFPNMGMGFLLVSIVYIFCLSLLYVHGITKRKMIFVVLNALVSPSLAWFILGYLFNISLP